MECLQCKFCSKAVSLQTSRLDYLREGRICDSCRWRALPKCGMPSCKTPQGKQDNLKSLPSNFFLWEKRGKRRYWNFWTRNMQMLQMYCVAQVATWKSVKWLEILSRPDLHKPHLPRQHLHSPHLHRPHLHRLHFHRVQLYRPHLHRLQLYRPHLHRWQATSPHLPWMIQNPLLEGQEFHTIWLPHVPNRKLRKKRGSFAMRIRPTWCSSWMKFLKAVLNKCLRTYPLQKCPLQR